MTRIIAGAAGGRRLAVPPTATRPTGERVREALFSALESHLAGPGPAGPGGTVGPGRLAGMRFLDLYAGSGAVGLEALSRGASHVLMVESDPRACSVIRRNAAGLRLGDDGGWELRCAPVMAVLEGAGARPPGPSVLPEAYDVVFADPPYAMGGDDVDAMVAAAVSGGWVGGVFVVERSSRSRSVTWPTGLVAWREKRYGDTTLSYARTP